MNSEARGISDSKWLAAIRKNLRQWFAKAKRDLPWRQTQDPYAIWISEIMLQQTQVSTVLPYYFRFLERFPTVQDLAHAEEQELMRYWAGLGYYRRARQMHLAAKTILEEHEGIFPTSFEEVFALPGIGRYTAGAICSFAYDARTPIVEANTQRLFARLLRWSKPLSDRHSQEILWEFAETLLPKSNGSRDINYAAMELGALVCKPQPDCPNCPLRKVCPTAEAGLQSSIPAPKAKTVYTDRYEIALLIEDSNHEQTRFLVRQCEKDEWWTGLWDFPRVEIDKQMFEAMDRPLLSSRRSLTSSDASSQSDSDDSPAGIGLLFLKRFGIGVEIEPTLLRTIRHSVTRYRIQLQVCRASLCDAKSARKNPSRSRLKVKESIDLHQEGAAPRGFQWMTMSDLATLPLSSSGRKVYQGLIRD